MTNSTLNYSNLIKEFKETARNIHDFDPSDINRSENCPICVFKFSEWWSKYPCYVLCTRTDVDVSNIKKWIKFQKHTMYNVNLKEVVKSVGLRREKTIIISDVKDSIDYLLKGALTDPELAFQNKLKYDQAQLERLRQSDENLLVFNYSEADKVRGKHWNF